VVQDARLQAVGTVSKARAVSLEPYPIKLLPMIECIDYHETIYVDKQT
jgi:hypothetical protein